MLRKLHVFQSEAPPTVILLCPFGGKLFSFVEVLLLLFAALRFWSICALFWDPFSFLALEGDVNSTALLLLFYSLIL